MIYSGARYQRIPSESNADSEAMYICTGSSGSKPCRGKLAFCLIDNGGELIECKNRLIKHRCHSEWCEFFKSNLSLIQIANLHGSLHLGKKSFHKSLLLEEKNKPKKKKTRVRSKKANKPPEEIDQPSSSGKSPEIPSNDLEEPTVCSASSSSSAIEKPEEPAASSGVNECHKEPASSSGIVKEGHNEPASGTANEEPEEEEHSEWDLCGKCKTAYDGQMPMVQCDLCSTWFHYECEHVTDEEAEKEEWFCSACRTVLAESERTNVSQSGEDAENMDEFLDKSLTTLNNFFDYLIEEAEPIKEKKFRVRLKLCRLKIEKVLNKYDGKDPENNDERQKRWKEMDEGLMNSFESIKCKLGSLNNTLEDFAQNFEENDDSPVELIGVGTSYGLSFEEEYERMSTSLRSSAPDNPRTVERNCADQPSSTSLPTESTNAKSPTISPADLPSASSLLPEQSSNGYQPSDSPPTMNREPKDLPGCSSPTRSSKPKTIDQKSPASCSSSTSQTNFEESGRESSTQPQESNRELSDTSTERTCSSQPTKKFKPGPIYIVLE